MRFYLFLTTSYAKLLETEVKITGKQDSKLVFVSFKFYSLKKIDTLYFGLVQRRSVTNKYIITLTTQ